MYMLRIVVVVLSLFCFSKGELQLFSIKNKTRITSNATYLLTVTVPSSIACARECTRNDCCTACYNITTNKCHLHRDCFPVTEHSDSGVFLRKHETSNIATVTSSHSTTLGKKSTTEISTTSNERSTAITIKSATEEETAAMTIDCSDIPGGSLSGVYEINVDNKPVEVYCEMRVDGQWTVIQKRVDGTTDFNRNWQDYKQGFGDLTPEYWIGNDNLHKILSKRNYKLRIDLKDWNGDTAYAEYDTFAVGSEDTNYALSISGYNGNAGDSILNPPSGSDYQMNGMEFSTSDRENDKHLIVNVAEHKRSGWWFNWATDANLNGIYYTGGNTAIDGIYWNSWQHSEYSLKSISMKIKPV